MQHSRMCRGQDGRCNRASQGRQGPGRAGRAVVQRVQTGYLKGRNQGPPRVSRAGTIRTISYI